MAKISKRASAAHIRSEMKRLTGEDYWVNNDDRWQELLVRSLHHSILHQIGCLITFSEKATWFLL
jgi:hypothetical protein